MDTQMNIDAKFIRFLRDQKAWSQDHLAVAAGVSLRTVQRVEAEGIASAETRLALASALGIPVSRLSPDLARASSRSNGLNIGAKWGWLGWGVGGVCSILGAYSSGLPIEEAGKTYGIIFGFLGLSAGCLAAFIRYMSSQRYKLQD